MSRWNGSNVHCQGRGGQPSRRDYKNSRIVGSEPFTESSLLYENQAYIPWLSSFWRKRSWSPQPDALVESETTIWARVSCSGEGTPTDSCSTSSSLTSLTAWAWSCNSCIDPMKGPPSGACGQDTTHYFIGGMACCSPWRASTLQLRLTAYGHRTASDKFKVDG